MSCNKFDFNERTCSSVDIGMDFIKTLTYTDSSDNAIDLTSHTFSMRIRQTKDGSDLLTLGIVGDTTSTGFYIADPLTGIIRLKITDVDTATFNSGNYRYDIIMTDPNGDKTIFMEGSILFTEGVI